MHMADTFISPAVGCVFWAGTAVTVSYTVHKLKNELDNKKIPLMGVVGAFVFAAQMINFTIPGTGSSGHIGGGMLLSILLGPLAGFLSMASVLLIQALFFADGGLLALGCNIFNLGFFTCFVAYPFIYKAIIRKGHSRKRLIFASVLSVVIALQLGAFAVVMQTMLSGKTELPFSTFVLYMQPIHLGIGLVEGVITAAIVVFMREARPDIIIGDQVNHKQGWSYKKVFIIFMALFLVVGGVLSWYASSYPDGLEWSIEKTTGSPEIEGSNNINETLSKVQEKTAFLPDYQFRNSSEESANMGTSVSGITGSVITLAFIAAVSFGVYCLRKKRRAA